MTPSFLGFLTFFSFQKQGEIYYTHQCIYCLVPNLQTLWQLECYYKEHG